LMRDVFASRFEIQESDAPAVARDKFEKGLVGLLGGSTEAAASFGREPLTGAHFIGQLLGLDFSASPYLKNLLEDAEQIRHRAFHYLDRFFRAIGQGGAGSGAGSEASAALLVAEDIHSSDDGSLDLIDHLAGTCQEAP